MSLREALENLPQEYWQNEYVKIRPLKTQDDLIYAAYDCRLSPQQQELVNPAWFSIGRAYLAPQDHYPCIICSAQGQPVGFICLSKWLAKGRACTTWSYFIQTQQQGKGYGRQAALLAIDILKAAAPDRPIKLASEVCNSRAHKLYLSLGFAQLEEMDGDDLVFGLFHS